jgi:hypothetical protein
MLGPEKTCPVGLSRFFAFLLEVEPVVKNKIINFFETCKCIRKRC